MDRKIGAFLVFIGKFEMSEEKEEVEREIQKQAKKKERKEKTSKVAKEKEEAKGETTDLAAIERLLLDTTTNIPTTATL